MSVRALAFLLLAACDVGLPTKERARDPERDDETGEAPCVPTAAIAANRTGGAIPLTVTFTGSASCPGEWAAAWNFGDGARGEGSTAAHTFLASGEHTVTLWLTDPAGETLTATVPIVVEPAACPELEAPLQVGTLGSAALTEASGLAEGLANPGVLWSHNDSGDAPRLFAMDRDGTPRGTFLLAGAPDGDWEDLAIGDLDGVPALLVGDIGANGGARDTLAIYVVPEPAVGPDDTETVVTDWWSFELAFPDGAALDADALFWDPATGDLYVIAHEADGTGIYRAPAPLAADEVALLERVAGFRFDDAPFGGEARATGAAVSPLGDRIAIRTPDHAWLWRRDQAAGLDAAWVGEACPLALADEPTGEAIAFSADGAGYYTTAEGEAAPIWYVGIVPPCDGLAPDIVVTDGTLEVGAEVTFGIDARCVPEGVASATWDFADGAPGSGATPTHTWLASGTWPVTLTITDGAGATATVTRDVPIAPAACPLPGATETWGTVANAEIVEASGLAASTLNPGVLWTHNDSADSPRLFALTQSGGHLAEYTVLTENRDWEDIALGWDDTLGGPALYVGDFGDNGSVRASIAVLVVPEPTIALADVPITADIATFATLTLTYPDGAHNAESLLHDPVTGDLYVVTKNYAGESAIFRKPAPHVDGTSTVLEHVADLVFGDDPLPGSGATTGGAFSPLGDRIAIRTYSHAWMWRRDQAFSVADAFAGAPCDLRAPPEEQGEAITFATDGAGYLTLSEGEAQPIHYTPLN